MVSLLVGVDEICDLSDEDKVLLCGFLLLNKPYGLKLRLKDDQSLSCFQNPPTMINMYRCPFAVEEPNGSTDDDTTYLISAGDGRDSAIIYQQRSADDLYMYPDGHVEGMLKPEQLRKMVDVGLLTTEGKKYVTYKGGSFTAGEIFQEYQDFLNYSNGKPEQLTK